MFVFSKIQGPKTAMICLKGCFFSLYWKRVVILEQKLANVLADDKHPTAQTIGDGSLVGGVRTTLALHNTDLKQRTSVQSKDRDNLLAYCAVVATIFRRLPGDIQTKIDRNQTFLEGE